MSGKRRSATGRIRKIETKDQQEGRKRKYNYKQEETERWRQKNIKRNEGIKRLILKGGDRKIETEEHQEE